MYSVVVVRRFVGLIAVYWVTGVGQAQEHATVPVVTVCEVLRGLDVYRGRSVIVVGNAYWTLDGTFMDGKCEPENLVLLQGHR